MYHRARLGQHFLKSRKVAEKIVEAAKVSKNDTVLEIGPGKGILTRLLLSNAKKVIAVEKDSGLVQTLKEKFSDEISRSKLVLVENDIRDFDPRENSLRNGTFVLVANIPYYITSVIIRKFLSGDAQPSRAVLLVQKEVALRIVGEGKSDDRPKESILSMSVKAYGTPKLVKTVKRTSFSPAPKVDSAILSIENISRSFFKDVDEKGFFETVRKGFSQKRKRLAKNLSLTPEALSKCGIPKNARAEDVSVEQWKCLVKFIG